MKKSLFLFLLVLPAFLQAQQPAVAAQTSDIDSCRISMFGSSVAYGTGATNDQGYAYLYDLQLRRRTKDGVSQYPFRISNISVGGNTTVHLLNRYQDLINDRGLYVIFGLSLGNEGIHGADNQDAVFRRWRDNMLTLIKKARQDGKIPVVMNNYTRADFNEDDYFYVRRLNLLIHEWDLPSVSTLGAIDDGAGHWAKGFENDPAHPNTAGHREFMYAIPPSLFDALAEGKRLPERDASQHTTLTGSEVFEFTGEGTVHPFAVSFTVNGNAAGRLLTIHSGSREAHIGVNSDHKAYYVPITGDSLIINTPLTDEWHTITLSHYYAGRRTLFYVDGEGQELKERIAPGRMTLGDETGLSAASRQYGELFFWRSALNPDEIAAHVSGKLLKSSLEIYMPLSDGQKTAPTNLAQTMNQPRFVADIPSGIKEQEDPSTSSTSYDLNGRPVNKSGKAAVPHWNFTPNIGSKTSGKKQKIIYKW